jgi:hypothetical protein
MHIRAHDELERMRVDGVVEAAMRRQMTMMVLVDVAE